MTGISTSADLEAGAVKVLEWKEWPTIKHNYGRGVVEANTPFNHTYCAEDCSEVMGRMGFEQQWFVQKLSASFATLDEAKSACQADFEARIRSALIPPSRAGELIAALRALLLPANEIDRQAGQMDPFTQTPVQISHDAIIDLRNAIDKADSLLAEIEEKTIDQ